MAKQPSKIVLITLGIFLSGKVIASGFAPFDFDPLHNNPTCYGSSDGMAWVSSITGGTPPFTFEWLNSIGIPIPGETNDTISGLPAGNYFCRITDRDGTRRTKPLNLVNPPVILYDEVIVDDVTCNGYNDGAISIEAVGGTGALEYSIDGGLNYQAGNTFAGLGPGSYNIIVQDENNCSKSYDFNPVTISEPGPLTITLDDSGNLTCWGSGDGYINVTPGGGILPYTFNWTGPGSFTSGNEDLVNLAAGSYNLVLTDANSCSENLGPVILTQPAQLVIIMDNIQNVTCNGAGNGSISVSVTGGTIPYNYLWTGPGSFSSNNEDISGLIPGNYSLQVTDANGCIKNSAPINVTEPEQLTPTLDSIRNVACNGGNNGAIYVSIAGGTSPYVNSWTGPSGFTSSSEDITNLIAGNYSLRVTDANGCNEFLGPLAVPEPLPVVIVTDSTNNPLCYGGKNGSIYISVSGGTQPYNYYWKGPGSFIAATEDITGLAAGNYNLTLTDANNCIKTYGPVRLSQPTRLSITFDTIIDISCFGNHDGAINITPGGGTPPYAFLWRGPGSYRTFTEDISNLAPGAYTLRLTDFYNCSRNGGPVNINEPPALSVVTDNIKNLSCFGSDDGAISVSVSGGTPPYSYAWTDTGSYTSTLEDISGLEPGNYNLVVTDANSCIRSLGPISIAEPAEIIITSDLVTNVSCNGGNDGAISISVTGGIFPLDYAWTGPGSYTSSDEDITGLFAGSYNLTVTDATGCFKGYGPINVNEPPVLNVSLDSANNVSCNGNDDGSIYTTAIGGVFPYAYAWTGPSTYSTDDITGLAPGTYNLEVTDTNNCKFNLGPVIITEPALLSVTMDSLTDISCFGAADGAIYVTVTGGTSPYINAWTGPGGFGSGTEDIVSLEKGNYTLTVTDANGCFASLPVQTINEPDSLTVVIDPTSVLSLDCFGDNNGRIDITPSGGTGTYNYFWTGPGGFNSPNQNISNLLTGRYDLLITDAIGCLKDTSVFIDSPPELIIDTVYLEDIAGCNGDNTGVIDIGSSGGSGAHEYSLDSGPFGSSGSFINLPAGIHIVTVRDINNCLTDTSVILSQPDTIGTSSISVVPVTCSGNADGSVSVAGSGGTLPYTYTLNPGIVINNTGLFTGLTAGTYTVTIDDSHGCPSYIIPDLIVTEAQPLVIDSTASVSISCWGMNDGQISIYVSGGYTPYLYSIDNGITYDSQSIHSGLPPAVYYIFIRDAGGCTIPGDTLSLSQPPQIIVSSESVSDIFTCFGDSTGSIEVTASGGTGSLQYSLDGINWQDSGLFPDLPGGNYQVTVIDSTACSVKSNVLSVNQPDAITAVITLVQSFNGEPGSIQISATGGTGTLEYSINGSTGPYKPDTAFINLWPGDYRVAVRDENGCIYEETVTLEAVPPLEIDVSYNSILCNGDLTGLINLVSVNGTGTVEYSIDDSSTFQADGIYENLPAGLYMIFVRDEDRRIFRDTVEIVQPDTILVTADIVPATCNKNTYDGSIDLSISGGTPGYTILWSNDSVSEDLNDLEAGLYTISITDANNCIYQDGYLVMANEVIIANAGNDTIVCTGEQVILEGSGGINYFWQPETGLSNPAVSNPVAIITDEREYILTVTEPGGCYDRDTVTIGVHPLPGIDAGTDTTVAAGQTIMLNASGGPFDAYSWMPQAGLDNPFSQSPSLLVTEDLVYYVTGTTTEGCIETDSVIITTASNLIIYSGFTPNDDGINDLWDIDNVHYYPNITVDVYTRWGGLVFSSKGYSSENRWDGTYKGKPVSVGTYWYVINLNDGSKPITGHVTIVR